jgi:hypothetical protein
MGPPQGNTEDFDLGDKPTFMPAGRKFPVLCEQFPVRTGREYFATRLTIGDISHIYG